MQQQFRSRARNSAREWQPTKAASSQSLESRRAGLKVSPAFFIGFHPPITQSWSSFAGAVGMHTRFSAGNLRWTTGAIDAPDRRAIRRGVSGDVDIFRLGFIRI